MSQLQEETQLLRQKNIAVDDNGKFDFNIEIFNLTIILFVWLVIILNVIAQIV